MNVSLTPELDDYVQQKVKTGLYHSASEVVREGLRLLQEHDLEREARLANLRRDIDLAKSQISRGEYSVYTRENLHTLADEVKKKGRELLARRQGKMP